MSREDTFLLKFYLPIICVFGATMFIATGAITHAYGWPWGLSFLVINVLFVGVAKVGVELP